MKKITAPANKWNDHYRMTTPDEVTPSAVLHENLHLLPAKGRSLDLAAGLGGNALLLAKHGMESHAWDISEVAMAHLSDAAHRLGLAVTCHTRDVTALPPEPHSFDLIIVSRFLDRTLCPAINNALCPGGLLFYQTFTVDSTEGPKNPAYRLQRNELFQLFPGLQIVYYREEGLLAKPGSEAMLVAKKP